MFDLFSAFKLFLRKIERIFITPIALFGRRVLRQLNPQNIVTKVATDVKKESKGITSKPTSIDQYYVVGDKLVAKKLVYIVLLLMILGAALFVQLGVPWLVSKFFTKSRGRGNAL